MELDFTCILQNSRTIIIERFNDQAKNLCTVLKGQDSDEAIVKVDEELCVKSFEEFKKKFKPTVYEVFCTDENGNLQVTYSLEICKGAHPISLCDHEFYKAVHDIAVEKSASNTDNNNIDYTKLYEALDPKFIYKRARRRRDDVRQFVTNALEEQKKGNPDGVKKWMLMAKQTHQSVKEEYAGSALRILPLVVRDTEMLLESRGITNDNIGIEGGSKTPELLPCSVKWDSEGNLVSVPLDLSKPEVLGIEQKGDKILQITQKNWESTADAINNEYDGSIDKNLFLSVYSEKENTALLSLTTDELKERKEIFGNMYVAAQQSFCNAVGYLVQKVASMEQFFIHASDENGIVESGVIIANCSVADIMENERYVKKYLKNASNNEKDRIWFAVLPATIDKDKKWIESSATADAEIDLFNMDLFKTNESSKNKDGIETVTISDINNISSLLAEFGILSFFNFNACEATSFKTFGSSSDIIKEYNKEVSAIKSTNSTVLVYPNFTIIPKNKRQVEVVNNIKFFTPSVYIDAAYVAAGIVVATQNMKIQKKKYGKKVINGRPFVRFDLEEEKSSQAFVAKFNPESRLNMDKEISMLLRGKNGNAFCFRSDSLAKNAFVFTARTMDAKPIYWFLTRHYFKFLMERSFINGMTSEKAKQFANTILNIVSNETDDSIVNQLLRSGEKFYYNEETTSFSFKFNGIDEPLDFVVNIDDDN